MLILSAMLTLESLIAQVRRRRVIRAALLYVLSAWFVVQAAYTILPMVGGPVWPAFVLLAVALIGFPFALTKAASAPPVQPTPPERRPS